MKKEGCCRGAGESEIDVQIEVENGSRLREERRREK